MVCGSFVCTRGENAPLTVPLPAARLLLPLPPFSSAVPTGVLAGDRTSGICAVRTLRNALADVVLSLARRRQLAAPARAGRAARAARASIVAFWNRSSAWRLTPFATRIIRRCRHGSCCTPLYAVVLVQFCCSAKRSAAAVWLVTLTAARLARNRGSGTAYMAVHFRTGDGRGRFICCTVLPLLAPFLRICPIVGYLSVGGRATSG